MNQLEKKREDVASGWDAKDTYEDFLMSPADMNRYLKEGFDAATALDLPVKFMNWTLSGDCDYECTDEDQWNTPDYSQTRETVTTKELYQYWIDNIYKPE